MIDNYVLFSRLKYADKDLDFVKQKLDLIKQLGFAGVQINVPDPKHAKVPISDIADYMVEIGLDGIVHGQAGGEAVDIGLSMDENLSKSLYTDSKEIALLQNLIDAGHSIEEEDRQKILGAWMKYNIELLKYSIHVADTLNKKGILKYDKINIHPGFVKGKVQGRNFYHEEEVLENIVGHFLELPISKFTFETIPLFHSHNLEELDIRKMMKREYANYGVGAHPIHMFWLLHSLKERFGEAPPLVIDFTHTQVAYNQILSITNQIGMPYPFYNSILREFLMLETAPICHLSGPTDSLVDNHGGFLKNPKSKGQYMYGVQEGLYRLMQKHDELIVVVEMDMKSLIDGKKQLRALKKDYFSFDRIGLMTSNS